MHPSDAYYYYQYDPCIVSLPTHKTTKITNSCKVNIKSSHGSYRLLRRQLPSPPSIPWAMIRSNFRTPNICGRTSTSLRNADPKTSKYNVDRNLEGNNASCGRSDIPPRTSKPWRSSAFSQECLHKQPESFGGRNRTNLNSYPPSIRIPIFLGAASLPKLQVLKDTGSHHLQLFHRHIIGKPRKKTCRYG